MYFKDDWWKHFDLAENDLSSLKHCGHKINSTDVWWRPVSNHQNKEVRSCRDAAMWRDRLGAGANGGIPLWAELKSLVGVLHDSESGKSFGFAAHTRANSRFEVDLVIASLGLRVENTVLETLFDDEVLGEEGIAPESLEKPKSSMSSGEWFGRVNPFNVDIILSQVLGKEIEMSEISQVFDISLKLDGGAPDTVMTNLGVRSVGFEIAPTDLFTAVRAYCPSAKYAHIAVPCPVWLGLEGKHRKEYWRRMPPPRGPKIGILTGNSPESGLTLWQDLLKTFRGKYRNLSDMLMPEVCVLSEPDMGISMELISREEKVRKVVCDGVSHLLQVGCEIITIACNTTIHFEPDIVKICEKHNARFISIAEACMPAVERALSETSGERQVGLLGIGTVVDMSQPYSGYRPHFEEAKVNVIPCKADALAFAVKNRVSSPELVTLFRNITKGSLGGVPVVVLALTEASMVYRDHVLKMPGNFKSTTIYIDPVVELSNYLIYQYLLSGYSAPICQIPAHFGLAEKLKL